MFRRRSIPAPPWWWGVKGEIAFSGQAGLHSIDPPGPPVTGETLFDLGSLTKPLVTTLALMRLVDRGRLDLDQPLSEIMPPGIHLGRAEGLTPRLLLCHSAGFPDWRPLLPEPGRRCPPASVNDGSVRGSWRSRRPTNREPG